VKTTIQNQKIDGPCPQNVRTASPYLCGPVFPLRFWCVSVCQKKSAILACLTMAKLKMNRRVPNKNADLLKKISLMDT